MIGRKALRIDWLLLLSTLAIVVIGLVYLYSASPPKFYHQLVFVCAGFACLVAILSLDYRQLLRHAYEFYGLVFGLLVVVLLLPEQRGAHSWIQTGLGFNIQPSELMKLALVLTLARHLMKRENQATLLGLVMPFMLTLAPLALILKQPDLGTGIMLPPLLFAVVFASGARVFHLLAVALSGLACFWPMWQFALKPYQKRRIAAFLDPDKYEATEAYQMLMSLIAIGSGGIFGSGWGEGTQNSLNLLPDKFNDFIFGVIAEEGGFFMAGVVLLLFLILVCEGLLVAYRTREPGGRLLAIGCVTVIGVQVLVNVGVVTGALPTTGITLPLISYGGSSMVVTFAMIGLLINISASQPFVLGPETFTGRIRKK